MIYDVEQHLNMLSPDEVKLLSFVGRGGSGKDTQLDLVLPYFPNPKSESTGTIIEESKNPDSYYGKMFYDTLAPYFADKDRGIILPDPLMVDIVRRIIKERSGIGTQLKNGAKPVQTYGFPGFPRTIGQDNSLDQELTPFLTNAGYSVRREMFYLDLPAEISFERAAKRLETALAEGRTPRRDDQKKVVARRNKEFDTITMKLVEKKLAEGTIHKIDANDTIGSIHEQIKQILGVGQERFVSNSRFHSKDTGMVIRGSY